MQAEEPHQLPKKIPPRLFASPEYCLRQKIQDRYGLCDSRRTYENESQSQATEAALLKYYPKYCRSLYFDNKSHEGVGDYTKPWHIASRVKQIKIIHHFEYDFGYDIDCKSDIIVETLENLLKNKRKSIKSLPVVGFQEEFGSRFVNLTIPEMSYFFPNIQDLKVYLPENQFSGDASQKFISGEAEAEILQTYGYFWEMLPYVEHLELTTMSPDLWLILPDIQDSKGFLSRLKTFRLTIISYNKNDGSHTPRTIFQSIFKNQDLLKYVTHLNFQRFKEGCEREWFHYYGDQIKSILDSCPKLQSVAFPILPQFYTSQGQFASSKRYLTLAPLQSFQNISALTLFVYDTWNMIEAFEFPPQLQKLCLHLYSMGWLKGKFEGDSEDSEDSEEEAQKKKKDPDEILKNFFARLKKAEILNSIELQMDSPSDFEVNKFILPMIRSAPKLDTLELLFIYGRLARGKIVQKLDLSTLLEAIVAPKQFKSFKLVSFENPTAEPDFLVTFNPPNPSLSFPNASFEIDTHLAEDFDFKAFFKMCSSESSQTKLKEIHLANIHAKSAKSFLKLLKIFKELGQFNGVKFNLGIALFVENMIEIKKNFKLPIIPARNVSLDVDIYISRKTKGKLTIPSISTLQNIFGKLTFNASFLVKEKSKKEIEEEEGNNIILAMQHNHVYVENPDGDNHEVEHTFM